VKHKKKGKVEGREKGKGESERLESKGRSMK